MSENGSSHVQGEEPKPAPMAYLRTTAVGSLVPLGVLVSLAGVLVSLFGFLLASYRDSANQLQANFSSYAEVNQAQHREFWSEIRSISIFLCARYPKWKKCE